MRTGTGVAPLTAPESTAIAGTGTIGPWLTAMPGPPIPVGCGCGVSSCSFDIWPLASRARHSRAMPGADTGVTSSRGI